MGMNDAVGHGNIPHNSCFITTSRKRQKVNHAEGRLRLSNVKFNTMSAVKHFHKKTNLKRNDLTENLTPRKTTILSSSIAETPPSDLFPLQLGLKDKKKSTILKLQEIDLQDLAIVTCYICNNIALGT